jgi:hypothetical protein
MLTLIINVLVRCTLKGTGKLLPVKALTVKGISVVLVKTWMIGPAWLVTSAPAEVPIPATAITKLATRVLIKLKRRMTPPREARTYASLRTPV